LVGLTKAAQHRAEAVEYLGVSPNTLPNWGGRRSRAESGVLLYLGRHLDQALGAKRLCTSDPLCAEHHPYRDSLTLHGAACHACLFLPETSCERGTNTSTARC
jgi:hypothetical protein